VNSAVFNKLLNKEWWRLARAIYELMKPVHEAITRLEADKPLLSQVLPIWVQLEVHVAAWSQKHKLLKYNANTGTRSPSVSVTDGVVKAFEERFEKHQLHARGGWHEGPAPPHESADSEAAQGCGVHGSAPDVPC
jgi:hypothetical protein